MVLIVVKMVMAMLMLKTKMRAHKDLSLAKASQGMVCLCSPFCGPCLPSDWTSLVLAWYQIGAGIRRGPSLKSQESGAVDIKWFLT